MKKRLHLLWGLGILFASLTSFGQQYVITNSALDVGNPGGLNTSSDATTGTVIQAYNNGSASTNLWSDPYAIPFTFNFNDNPVTHLMVSKNGLLTFDTTNTGVTLPAALDTNSALPNVNLPNNTIAYFWDDMATSLSSNDQVHAFTLGTAPNRQLWILNYSFYLSTSSFNYFAVVLEETSNKIYVVDMNYASSASAISATVGIQINSTTAYQVTTPLNGANGSPNIQFGPGSSGAADNEYYEFTFYAAGACLPPSNLMASATTSSTASASWTTGGASNSLVEYGPQGFALGSGTQLYVATNSASLTALTPNTTYDVYVKDSCASNASPFIGPVSFTTPCASAMNGTYTINSGAVTGGTNFNSFADAAAELNACGVTGPVTLNVIQGTYSEQIVIDSIPGASASNPVIIQPAAANTMPVELTYAASGSADNYVIKFNGAEYVTVTGLTMTAGGTSYGYVVDFEGNCANVMLDGNTLNGLPSSSTSSNYAVIYNSSSSLDVQSAITIKNNQINNGSYGIYWYGLSSGYEMNNSIDSNIIQNYYYYGIYSYYQDGITFNGNTIEQDQVAPYSTGYGISNNYGDNSSAMGNVVNVYGTSTNYGVYFNYCDASSGSPNMIANNMISCNGNTGSTYGIYPYNNYYTDIVYNSINVSAGSSTAGRAIYLNSSTTGTYGNINLQNNSAVNTGGGYAFEVSSGAVTLGYVTASDYNNMYATGATLARVNNSNYADLAAYQVAVPTYDQNSVSADPLYYGPTDLHAASTTLNAAGSAYAGITIDIDGDTRAATPDIGADEFAPPTCIQSTNFVVVTLYADSATVAWSPGTGSTFNLEYDTLGFTQGTGTQVTGIVDTFYTITGLNSTTSYEFYVQDDCGSGDTSIWAGPLSFTTLCGPFTAPHTETFDGTADPLCWSQSAGSGGPWVYSGSTNSVNCSAAPDHTGNSGNYAWMDQSGTDARVILQMNDVDVSSVTTPGLEFYYWMCGVGYSPINVTLVEAWNGTGWDVVDSIVTATNGWERMVYDLSGFTFATDLVRIRFRAESGGNSSDFYGDNAIDDVTIGDFTTLYCAQPFTAPYLETFDNTSTPLCWAQSAGSGGPWLFSGSTNSVNCAAAPDHTGNSGSYAWMDQSGTDAGVVLEMHDVDVSGLTHPYLEFYYWMCGVGYTPPNITVIEMWNGSSWVVWDSIQVATTGWQKMGDTILPSQTYNSGLVKVRFRAESGGNANDFYGDNALDDIQIMEAPSCTAPTGLTLIGKSDSTATVYWTTGGASTWNIAVGPLGFTPPGSNFINAINDTATITGLTPGTEYDVYVRDSCAVGDASLWVGPLTLVTSPCDTANRCVHTIILSDDFGDGWNGTEVTVYQNGAAVAVLGAGFTGSTGSPAGDTLVTTLALCDSVPTHFVITTGSTTGPYWSQEIGLEVIDPFNVPVGFYDNNINAAQGDTVISFMSSCAAPSCLPPTSIGVFNISGTGAVVYFTPGGASNWNIEYGPTGFTRGTGTLLMVTNDTVGLSGLTPTTGYDFYVQDSCGVGNVSAWIGPTTFTTAIAGPRTLNCGTGFPGSIFTEEFDNSTSFTGDINNGNGSWLYDNNSTGSSSTGPSGPHSGTHYIFAETSTGGLDTMRMVSPQIDLSAATTAVDLSFWLHAYGATIGTLNVGVSTSATGPFTNVFSFGPGQLQMAENDPYQNVGVNLDTYLGQTIYIQFEYIRGTSFTGDLAIDLVEVITCVACPSPTALGVAATTDTSASVYWTSGGAANSNVSVGPLGFSPGAGTITSTTNDTLMIGGLTPGTQYEFYVQDSCGVGAVSNWVGPFAFNTDLCDTSNTCPYQVTLTDAFGDGWNGTVVTAYQGGIAVGVLGPNFTTGSSSLASIPLCDGADVHFVVTTGGIGAPFYLEEVGLEVRDQYNILLGTYLASTSTALGDTLVSFMVNCAPPGCLPPTALGAYGMGLDSAIVFWTGNNSTSNYWVEYGPTGFAPGSGTTVQAINDTSVLSGLMSSTCYDYYVLDSCGAGNLSLWVGPYKFCTQCSPVTSYPYIQDFETAGPLLSSTGMPVCFSASSSAANGAFNWYPNVGATGSTNTGPTADHTFGNVTGKYVYTEASSPAATGDSAILLLREFDMTPLTNPEFVFWYHMYGADIQNLNLEVWNTTTMTWDSIYGIAGQQQTTNSDPWLEARLNMSAYLSSTNLRLRFITVRGASFDGDVGLDDIIMRETPLCIDPTNLAIGAVGLNSIGLTWTSDTNVTSSVIQYGPTGFVLGSGTIVPASGGTATISALMSGTCYDFYVLDSCGAPTSWVGPVNGCTSSPCTVTGTPSNVLGDTTGCGGGNVILTTSTTGNVGWLRGSEVVGTGSQHLDSINFTTTFMAALYNNAGPGLHVGPTPTSLPGGFGNFTNGHWITVMDTLTIDSITVRANGYVKAEVVVWDADTSLDRRIQRSPMFETDSGVTADKQVYLGVLLTPGTYYVNVEYDNATIGALYRATSGAVFPYSIPGLISVDSVNFNGGQVRYYYIFDMVVRGACLSTGVPALAVVPGANAGSDATVSVCGLNSNVNLAGYLGVHDFGGTWSDDSLSGALTDSIFDATAVAPGTYGFTYALAGTGGCAGDSATLTVTVVAGGTAGADSSFAVCITGGSVQLRNYLTGSTTGTFTNLDNAQGVLGGSLILPATTGTGTFRFRYTLPGGICPADTALLTITIDTQAVAGADVMDTVCDTSDPVDLNNYLAAGAVAGGSWVDLSGSGALTGSTFDPNAVTAGASYTFRYRLINACGADSAEITLYVEDCFIGLKEYTTAVLEVYPNPTSGVCFIRTSESGSQTVTLELYSASGKLMLQREAVLESELKLDMSKFADGIYNLKISGEDISEVHRISKM